MTASPSNDIDTADATAAVAADIPTAAPAAEQEPIVLPAFSGDAGLEGAASFADAESREILNLLGDAEAGGSCCGGSCCAV